MFRNNFSAPTTLPPIPEVVPKALESSPEQEFTYLNRYQLEFLFNQLKNNNVSLGSPITVTPNEGWYDLSFKTGGGRCYDFDSELPGDYESDCVEAIWICRSSFNLREILDDLLKTQQNDKVISLVNTFKDAIASGYFKSQNNEGVSLSHIIQLGSEIDGKGISASDLRAIQSQLRVQDYRSATGDRAYPNHKTPESFTEFLHFFWEIRPEAALETFCNEVELMLTPKNNISPRLKQQFQEAVSQVKGF